MNNKTLGAIADAEIKIAKLMENQEKALTKLKDALTASDFAIKHFASQCGDYIHKDE